VRTTTSSGIIFSFFFKTLGQNLLYLERTETGVKKIKDLWDRESQGFDDLAFAVFVKKLSAPENEKNETMLETVKNNRSNT